MFKTFTARSLAVALGVCQVMVRGSLWGPHHLRSRHLQENDAVVTEGTKCMEDVEPATYGCTAGDVQIESVEILSVNGQTTGPFDCFRDDDILVNFVAYLKTTSNKPRYDVGIWLDQTGTKTDARAGGPNDCAHVYFAADERPEPTRTGLPDLEVSGEKDTCGDIDSDGPFVDPSGELDGAYTPTIKDVSIVCEGTGTVLVGYCIGYKTPGQQNVNCDEFAALPGNDYALATLPGTSSKCTCESVQFPIEILQCDIEIQSITQTPNVGIEQGTVDVEVIATTSYGAITYSWTQNGESFPGDRFLDNVDPALYAVTVTDERGCTAEASIPAPVVCAFLPTCIAVGQDLPCTGTIPDSATITDVLSYSDPCDTPILLVEESTDGDDKCSIGGVTRTYTYTAFDDLNGDSTYNPGVEFLYDPNPACTQVYTIAQDETPPVFDWGSGGAPSDITVECDAVPVPPEPSATDDCGPNPEVVYSFEDSPLACAGSYTQTRTWTAVDDCGNEAMHTQQITVQDTIPPEFDWGPDGAPQDITVECNAIPTRPTLVATDNCDESPVVTYSGDEVSEIMCAGTYTLTRTWTVVDDCANEATHVQTITVEDTTPPVFEGPLPTEATFECMEAPRAFLSATDNCGEAIVTFVEGKTDGDCPYDYLLTRTWTATDDCGLTTTHTQAVTVQDTIAPVFVEVCPTNVPFNICTDGAITPAETLTATDNCENVVVTYNCCFDASTDAVTRTWSVSDSCGNSATDCVQTIAIDPTCGA